jgi:hypothetical protein
MKTAGNTMNAQVRELTEQELDLVGGGTTATGGTTTSGTSGSQTTQGTHVIAIIAILIG